MASKAGSTMAAAVLAAGIALLSGCGASGPDGSPAAGVAVTARVVPTLLDDEGRANVVDPLAKPGAAGAQTRAGRYASAAQAMQLTAAVGNRVLPVAVECCGAEGVDATVEATALRLAERPDVETVALLVSGHDLAQAAAVADRVEPLAPGRVWLVTQ